eukprot:Em0006g446a
MNGSTVMCNNTDFMSSASTIVSMTTINVVGPPGRPNPVLANTIGPGMVQVMVNPSSSGGLPTSYSVTISNSSYMNVCSNSTPAFLNGSAMFTCNGLTNSTNYTISAVAINCAGSSNSSNPTTIYVSCMCKTMKPLNLIGQMQESDFRKNLSASVWLSADSLPSLDEVFTLKCSLIYFDLPSGATANILSCGTLRELILPSWEYNIYHHQVSATGWVTSSDHFLADALQQMHVPSEDVVTFDALISIPPCPQPLAFPCPQPLAFPCPQPLAFPLIVCSTIDPAPYLWDLPPMAGIDFRCQNSQNHSHLLCCIIDVFALDAGAAPPPSPPTSSASNPSTTSPTPKPTPTPDTIIGAVLGAVVGGVAVIVVIIVVVVLLICLCKTSTENKTKEQQDVQVQLVPPQPMPPPLAPRDPIATRQASKVPAEESLYNASTQDQRVPEESLYDGGVGPAGNVPTGRGGNVQEAVYSQPDTSKKNTDKMMYAAVQVAPAARNPPSERAGRRMPPPPNTSQQQDVFYSTSLPCHTASGDNCTSSICPNTVVTYTCTITSGTPGGLTDWTLPTLSNTFPDRIRLSQLVSGLCAAMVISTCGPYRASSIQSSDPTYCLSSIMAVNITAALNGSTVMCNIDIFLKNHPDGIQATTVTVPSNNPHQLTVTWTPLTTGGVPTSYNVTFNDSSSPVVIADNGSPVYTHTFTGLVSDTVFVVASNGTSKTS